MTHNAKKTQHRPNRELTKAQENSGLKQENRSLKRQVLRLRKSIENLGEAERIATQDAEGIDIEQIQEDQPGTAGGTCCPLCRSANIGTYKAPSGKVLVACKACKKWRTSVESA